MDLQKVIEKQSQRIIWDKRKAPIAVGLSTLELLKLWTGKLKIKELEYLTTGIDDERYNVLRQGVVGKIPRDTLVVIIRKVENIDGDEDDDEEDDSKKRRALAIQRLLPECIEVNDVVRIMKRMQIRCQNSTNIEAIKIIELLQKLYPKIMKKHVPSIKQIIDLIHDHILFKGIIGFGKIVRTELDSTFTPIMDDLSLRIRDVWDEDDIKFPDPHRECGGAIWFDTKYHIIQCDDLGLYFQFLDKKKRDSELKKPIYNMNFDLMQFHESTRSVSGPADNLIVKQIKSMGIEYFGGEEEPDDDEKKNNGIEWMVTEIKDKYDSSKTHAIIKMQPGESLLEGLHDCICEYCDSDTFTDWIEEEAGWTLFSGHDEETTIKVIKSLKKEKEFLMIAYDRLYRGIKHIIAEENEDEEGDIALRDKINDLLASCGQDHSDEDENHNS